VWEYLPSTHLSIAIAPSAEHKRTLRARVEGTGPLAAALQHALDDLPPIPGITDIGA
jgi:hypothetical protein